MRGWRKEAVAQSSINQGDVQSLIFPLPPLAEQHTIVRRLSIVVAKIAAEECAWLRWTISSPACCII
jgi:restriction endonuclease S subunit